MEVQEKNYKEYKDFIRQNYYCVKSKNKIYDKFGREIEGVDKNGNKVFFITIKIPSKKNKYLMKNKRINFNFDDVMNLLFLGKWKNEEKVINIGYEEPDKYKREKLGIPKICEARIKYKKSCSRYYVVTFFCESKKLYQKFFNQKKYKLEDVIIIRDEVEKELRESGKLYKEKNKNKGIFAINNNGTLCYLARIKINDKYVQKCFNKKNPDALELAKKWQEEMLQNNNT